MSAHIHLSTSNALFMTQDLSTMHPRHPSLYRLAADGRSLDFLFSRCQHCQGLNFPANVPGCIHCGAALAQAESVIQTGEGSLLAYVTVHVPLRANQAVPAIVGDIRIADNIVQECVLAVDDESALRPGMTLKAVAIPDGDVYDCRFVPISTREVR